MSSKVATGASVPGVVNTTNAYCIALHQYPSSKPDELALVPGDVIQVMKKADDGWWYGRKIQPAEDKLGWFPSNFNYEPTNIDIKKQGITYARADFEYKAQEEDELNLTAGDMITIINTEEDEGWHRGILNGRVGLFPANFVKLMAKTDLDKDKKSIKKVMSGLAPNERRASLMPSKFQEMQQQAEEASEKQKGPAVLCMAVVSYDYAAQQPDELTLTKGMKISVTSKDDEGWWTGTDVNGKTGVFPFNFVTETPVSESATQPMVPKMLSNNSNNGSVDKMANSVSPPAINSKPPTSSPNVNLSLKNQSVVAKPGIFALPKTVSSLQPAASSMGDSKKSPPILTPKPSVSRIEEAIQSLNINPAANKPMGMGIGEKVPRTRAGNSPDVTKNTMQPESPKPEKNVGSNKTAIMPPMSLSAVTTSAKDLGSESPENGSNKSLNHITKHRVSVSGRRPPSILRVESTPDMDSEIPTLVASSITSEAIFGSDSKPKEPKSVNAPVAVVSTKKTGSIDDVVTQWGQMRDTLQQWMKQETLAREQLATDISAIRKSIAALSEANGRR